MFDVHDVKTLLEPLYIIHGIVCAIVFGSDANAQPQKRMTLILL